MFTLYLEYFNIFFFSYLFIFISPPFPFLLLLLSPHSHNHLLFVASIRPRWSCQSRLSAANLACPAAVLVAHPYHRPISPLIFGENFETFDWILGCEWRVWFFFLFANLRFLCVEFNWFLRNMMDFEFWKLIFSIICLTMWLGCDSCECSLMDSPVFIVACVNWKKLNKTSLITRASRLQWGFFF